MMLDLVRKEESKKILDVRTAKVFGTYPANDKILKRFLSPSLFIAINSDL